MNKLVICTTGTSIANSCPAARELMKQNPGWDYEAKELKKQIAENLARPEKTPDKEKTRRNICAEINALDRIKISSSDSVVLIVSDNALGRACAEMIKEVLLDIYGLGSPQVEIRRIEGMQVHDAQMLRNEGLRNLVDVVVGDYLTNPDKMYSYDIILNPVGGYKVIVPFLTVLGMLYGKRTVYIFEHADSLINLPPLPFSFDLDLYERAKPAIGYIERETAVPEQAFFSKIAGYTPEEKEIFSAFIEPIGDGTVTLSPLTFCLLSGREKSHVVMVKRTIKEKLSHDNNISGLALKRMLNNLSDPLWRATHIHTWSNTDFLFIKRSSTAERLAGFIKSGTFHVTHAFEDHDDYERVMKNCSVRDFSNEEFVPWEETKELGVNPSDRDALMEERDRLLIENQQLRNAINNDMSEDMSDAVSGLELRIKDLEDANSVKDMKMCSLEELIKTKQCEINHLQSEMNSLTVINSELEVKLAGALENVKEFERTGQNPLVALFNSLFKRAR